MEQILEKLTKHIEQEITSKDLVLLRKYLNNLTYHERIVKVASLKRIEIVECLLKNNIEILDCYIYMSRNLGFNLSSKLYELLIELNNEELIIKYLDDITYDYLKHNLIILIKSDDLRMQYIKNSQIDNDKYLMAKTLDSDINKSIALEYIQNVNLKTKLVCEIHDEIVRTKMLMIVPAYYRMRVCKTFTSQEILRDLYQKNIKSFFSYEILSLIHDDELKIEMINNYSMIGQIKLIISLDHEENIMKFIMDNKYDDYCDSFIESLSCNNIIKYFNKITNLNYKIRIINSVKDIDIKRKLILLIENEDIKRILLGILNNDKKNILEDVDISDIKYDIDKNITIGVELEVCCYDKDTYLKIGKMLPDWPIKLDRTVDNGFEITSPILHYDESSLKELKYVCDVLERNSFYTNDSCGGHIHLGFDYFDNAKQLKVFLLLYKNVEDILYLISNRTDSVSRIGINKYAKTLKPVINDLWVNIDKMNNLSKMVKLIKERCDSRYYGLNLSNAFDKKHTLEFRMPNGEINFQELLLNIRLFSKLLEKSKELGEILNKNKLSLEEINKLKLYYLITNESVLEEEKLEYLLILLFNNLEIDKYLMRYQENKKKKIKEL